MNSPGKAATKVLIIAVHYRSQQSMVALLESLRVLKHFSESEIIVVDNHSGDEHLFGIKDIAETLPNVQLLVAPENRGYFGGAKFGLDAYQSFGLPNWIVVCNADVLIEDEDFFVKLFKRDPLSVGVVAPRITIKSNSRIEQNPFMIDRPGKWRRFTMRFYSSCYLLGLFWDWLSRQKRAFHANISSGSAANSEQVVYAAHGSFMIFSRRFFEMGGYLDNNLFLFGEEIAVGEVCRNLGLSVVYDPKLHVLHDEHQSVGAGMTRNAYQYHRQSVRYLFSKYLA